MSVSTEAVDILENSTEAIEGAIDSIDGSDVSASEILQATVDINDATNLAAAATSAYNKENDNVRGALRVITS